ncbi:hypothetical protein RHGRI_021704 [Rhododendron griersonianum]|uniref:Uncharacterized protein n=1 Tax=Rhododendron griersonianum TaxID=479676 RepID=A0AAV6JLH2_9ERIC|nr:hypothetical protein RHGRI_021704 [Rhododendron griersonianum]
MALKAATIPTTKNVGCRPFGHMCVLKRQPSKNNSERLSRTNSSSMKFGVLWRRCSSHSHAYTLAATRIGVSEGCVSMRICLVAARMVVTILSISIGNQPM